MNAYFGFKNALLKWSEIAENQKKFITFKKLIGSVFVNFTQVGNERTQHLPQHLFVATGYKHNADFFGAITNLAKGNSGSSELAIALYLLCKLDRNYQMFVPEIEKLLFGSKECEKSIGWTFPPHATQPVSSQKNDDTQNLALNPEVPFSPQPRLSPAPKSSQDTHYSRRLLNVLGREKEQEALRRFVSAAPGFRWLQLAGVGGQGKSRLANELIRELSAEWEKGFLRREDMQAFDTHWTDWRPIKPHLIVIDYIIGAEGDIGRMMKVLAGRALELAMPVCVLLIERQCWNRGGLRLNVPAGNSRNAPIFLSESQADWFGKLNSSYDGDDLAHDGVRFESGVVELTKLASLDLIRIVRKIAKSVGGEFNHTDEFIADNLEKIDRAGRPLYAYFFAQALIDGQFHPDWDRAQLLRHVLDREHAKRWTSPYGTSKPTLSDDHPALKIALLATMTRFVDCAQLTNKLNWGPIDSGTRRQALALVDGPIESGATGPGRIIPGLEPDILGEWFVLTAFDNGNLLELLSDAAWASAPRETASFLLRLTQDFPDHPATITLLKSAPMTAASETAYSAVTVQIIENLTRAFRPVPKELIHTLQRASNEGDPIATRNLGFCYFQGIGVEKAVDRAFDYFKKSVDAGNIKAISSLAYCFFTGQGVDRNLKKAVDWYKKGAEAGSSEAMSGLGFCYFTGQGAEKDFTKALIWFREGATLGDGRSMDSLGFCYLNGQGIERDFDKALEWFCKGAEIGYGGAMANLGFCYFQGLGVEQNLGEALIWFRKGAESGHGGAMANLGFCYLHGLGTDVDITEAVGWYTKGSMAGDASAMWRLGHCYAIGQGVKQDATTAAQLYYEGAMTGDCQAMYYLATCYAHGQGIEKDSALAEDWYRRAADAGYQHK